MWLLCSFRAVRAVCELRVEGKCGQCFPAMRFGGRFGDWAAVWDRQARGQVAARARKGWDEISSSGGVCELCECGGAGVGFERLLLM